MIAYADASFIVSLFAHEDQQWQRAWQWWRSAGLCQVLISRLTLLETENALHLQRLDHQLPPAEFNKARLGLERARMEGLLIRRETPAHRLYPESHRLVAHYFRQATSGTLDILHVAAALVLRADTFLTFDNRQAKLARAAGLAVAPVPAPSP